MIHSEDYLDFGIFSLCVATFYLAYNLRQLVEMEKAQT